MRFDVYVEFDLHACEESGYTYKNSIFKSPYSNSSIEDTCNKLIASFRYKKPKKKLKNTYKRFPYSFSNKKLFLICFKCNHDLDCFCS